MSFSSKPLIKTSTLGERLKEARGEMRQTIADAAEATMVPVHHLASLESGRYEDLPGDVYTRNFLRRYARFLRLNEERVLESYDAERGLVRPRERRLPSATGLPGGITITLLARRTLIVLVIIGVLGYLGWEVGKILAPPTLLLTSPTSSGITQQQTVEVRGQTDPEASVTINGQAVFVDEQGVFTEVITLAVGRNTILVTAAKKRGQRSTLSREMIFEEPIPPPAGETATPPSSGN